LQHREVCPQEPADCLKGCGTTLPRCELWEHMNSCIPRCACLQCELVMSVGELPRHLPICPMGEVLCPNCGLALLRRGLPLHLNGCVKVEEAAAKEVAARPAIQPRMQYHVCDFYCIERAHGPRELLGCRGAEDPWLNLAGDPRKASKRAARTARKHRTRTSWGMIDPVAVHWKGTTNYSAKSKLRPKPDFQNFLRAHSRTDESSATAPRTQVWRDAKPIGAVKEAPGTGLKVHRNKPQRRPQSARS